MAGQEQERVGFIGPGAMGSRMAANVLAAGYPLAATALETYATYTMAMGAHGGADSARIAAYIDEAGG